MDKVEGIALGLATGMMLLYFIVFLLATWSDRPRVGRYENGRPRPVRAVHNWKGTR